MKETKNCDKFHIMLAGFVVLTILAITSALGFIVILFNGDVFWPLFLLVILFSTLARRFFFLTAEAA